MRLSVLWSSAWRIAIVALTLVWLPGLSAAACTSHPSPARHRELSPRALARYEWAREHLDAPFHGYDMTDDLDVHAFDVVLLSNLASGLMNVGVLDPTRRGELRLLAEETARRALSAEVSPIGAPVDPAQLGDHNLYASHVLLILGSSITSEATCTTRWRAVSRGTSARGRSDARSTHAASQALRAGPPIRR